MSDQWSDGQEKYINMELRPTTTMGACFSIQIRLGVKKFWLQTRPRIGVWSQNWFWLVAITDPALKMLLKAAMFLLPFFFIVSVVVKPFNPIILRQQIIMKASRFYLNSILVRLFDLIADQTENGMSSYRKINTSLNQFWDRSQNMTTFETTGFVVTKSGVAGHFESYNTRILEWFKWSILGVAQAWHGCGRGAEDTRDMPAWSLKKTVILLNAPAVCQNQLLTKIWENRRNGAWKAKKRAPPCTWGFYTVQYILLFFLLHKYCTVHYSIGLTGGGKASPTLGNWISIVMAPITVPM